LVVRRGGWKRGKAQKGVNFFISQKKKKTGRQIGNNNEGGRPGKPKNKNIPVKGEAA